MKELAVELICAHPPRAEGRVERADQTPQDRLVKELRLRGICSMAEANAYLPESVAAFNRRFAVAPRSAEEAHRPLAATDRLDRLLALCERRTLSKNLTPSYRNVIYQIQTRRAAYTMRGARVEVRAAGGGEVSIEYKGRALSYSVCGKQEQRQAQVIRSKLVDAALSRPAQAGKRKTYHPPPSHPWKYCDYREESMGAMEKRGDICILRKEVTSLLGVYTAEISIDMFSKWL